jgi:hypothetical protein
MIVLKRRCLSTCTVRHAFDRSFASRMVLHPQQLAYRVGREARGTGWT